MHTQINKLVKAILCSGVVMAGAAVPSIAQAAPTWHNCDVRDVTEVSTPNARVQVRCWAPSTPVGEYIAIGVTDAARAQRFLSIALAAQLSGRKFSVLIDPATSAGNVAGCGAADCRTPTIWMHVDF
jgi:hypothetical protein